MKYKVLAVLSLIIACWLALPTLVGAVPPTPATFYGPVRLNGQNIPDGTDVSAWIGGVRYAHGASFRFQGSSYYNLSIPGDDPDTAEVKEGGRPGEVITFRIGSVQANETATWLEGFSPDPPDVGFPLTATSGGSMRSRYLPALLKNSPYTAPRTTTPTPTRTRTPTRTPSSQSTATPFPTALTITQVEDTYIRVTAEDANYGTAGELWIKTASESMRPLIRFDLPRFPPNAIIVSGMMTLWTNWWQPVPNWPMNVQCYPMQRQWAEKEATWKLAAVGQPWGLPGADDTRIDRQAAQIAQTMVQSVSTPYEFNITTAVRQWAADPNSNHGLILIAGEGNLSTFHFWSSDYTEQAKRPKLEIVVFIPPS